MSITKIAIIDFRVNYIVSGADKTMLRAKETMSPTKIATMPRNRVIKNLLNFEGSFKFDFTREYLEKLSTDQLRHLLLAAYLHASGR